MYAIATMIQPFEIAPSANSPHVYMNAETGEIVLEGKSFMPDSYLFYMHLVEWVQEYVATKPAVTSVELFFEYMDSRSSKHIYSILHELEQLNFTGSKIFVKWLYERGDEDMLELMDMVTDNLSLHIERIELDET